MRCLTGRMLALFICALLCAAVPSQACVKVVWGESWRGSSAELQSIVDGLYGAGQIDVKTDYLGARTGDPDPWFWTDNRFSALLVKVVAGSGEYGQVGWYEDKDKDKDNGNDKDKLPVIRDNGIHDGLVFDGPLEAGATAVVKFRKPVKQFGFYLNPNGPGDAVNAFEPERFYTNRDYNDAGPDGSGALHFPCGGDMQALVFDISSLKGQRTWLVCFESDDSGAMPGPLGQAQTDNDYSDVVFEVTSFCATAGDPLSFGGFKARYLH